jgi:hypothetical protein
MFCNGMCSVGLDLRFAALEGSKPEYGLECITPAKLFRRMTVSATSRCPL